MANPLVVEVKIEGEIVAATYDRWGAFDNVSVLTRSAEYAKLVKGCDVQTAIERCKATADAGCVVTDADDIEAYEEWADVIVEIDVTNDEVIVYDLVEIKASIDNFVEYAERFSL